MNRTNWKTLRLAGLSLAMCAVTGCAAPTEQTLGVRFNAMPLWLFAVISFVLSTLAIECGFRVGHRWQSSQQGQDGPVGTVVGASLALLAFLLAFTFGITAARFETRKSLLLDDVNAIHTTYLRASLLREPHRTEIRQLLSEYVDIRARLIYFTQHPGELKIAISRTDEIQDALWSHATAIASADRSSEIDALFISSLNEMIDLNTKRMVIATQYHIPLLVLGVLIFVSTLTMAAVGFQFGLAGKRVVFANLVLALTFSAVLFLIRDLDNPGLGWLIVDQQPMIDLQKMLNAPNG